MSGAVFSGNSPQSPRLMTFGEASQASEASSSSSSMSSEADSSALVAKILQNLASHIPEKAYFQSDVSTKKITNFSLISSFFEKILSRKEPNINDDLFNQAVQECKNCLDFRKDFIRRFLYLSKLGEKPLNYIKINFNAMQTIAQIIKIGRADPKVYNDIFFNNILNKKHIQKSGFICRVSTVEEFKKTEVVNLADYFKKIKEESPARWSIYLDECPNLEKVFDLNADKADQDEIVEDALKTLGLNLIEKNKNYLYYLSFDAGHALPIVIFDGRIISPIDFDNKNDGVRYFIENSDFGKNFDSKIFLLPGNAFKLEDGEDVHMQATNYSCKALTSSVLSRVASCVEQGTSPFHFFGNGSVLLNPTVYAASQSEKFLKNYIAIYNKYAKPDKDFSFESLWTYKHLGPEYRKDYLLYLGFKNLSEHDVFFAMQKLKDQYPDMMNNVLQSYKEAPYLGDLFIPPPVTTS